MVGVFGIQGLAGDVAQFAEGGDGWSGRRGLGLDLSKDVLKGSRFGVVGDGAIEVIGEATHATMEPGQNEQGGTAVDGIEKFGRDGVHLGEGLEVARWETSLVGDAAEGVDKPAFGIGTETPVRSGGGHGVAGGAAQCDGGRAGFAEGQVDVSAVVEVAAALLVMGYGADGEFSFWVDGREAGSSHRCQHTAGWARNYLTYFFVYSARRKTRLRAGSGCPGGHQKAAPVKR